MLDLTSLQKSINALDKLLIKLSDDNTVSNMDEITIYAFKSGIIQHFEFTYELCWKFIKRWLEINYYESYTLGITKKQLFRLAAKNNLINSFENWMEYHEARNITSHTYDETKAEDVYNVAVNFIHDAKELLTILEEKND